MSNQVGAWQWEAICSFANLRRAARLAAQGKHHTRAVARFWERCEGEVLRLQEDLRSDTWRPGTPTVFLIRDPKERRITAAPFRDRVVHHALVGPLEAVFEAALVDGSFACRKGKGTGAALEHAKDMARSWAWFLKLDIAKCFESIPHRLVLETLGGLGLEDPVLRLCAHVLRGPEGSSEVGLPIGNLTSQWFANLVLGRVDRLILAQPGIAGYARYMDDFLVCAADKDALRRAEREVRTAVDGMGLALKQRATILAPVAQGIPFLGWQIHPGAMRLRPENARRARRRLKHRRHELRAGLRSAASYRDAVRSVLAHARQGAPAGWLRRTAAECCAREQELESPTCTGNQRRQGRCSDE